MLDAGDELYGFQSTLHEHPLDPLRPHEIKKAAEAVVAHLAAKNGGKDAGEVRFIEVALKEADKIRVVLAKHKKDAPPPARCATAIIWEKARFRAAMVVRALCCAGFTRFFPHPG